MGLGFLSPLFLAGLAAAAIPILLHLFRRQADPVVPFGAVRLLRRTPVEQAQRRRLREWILLALRITALALLALSFARPYFAGSTAAAAGPLTIVAVDTSYSLSAPGQMDRARALANAAIDEAAGPVALLRFDTSADVVVPASVDRAAARAAVRSLASGEGGTSYARLVSRALEVAANRRAELVVITDLQQAGWTAGDEVPPAANLGVSVREVPAPKGNLGITQIDRVDGHAVVQVSNRFPNEQDTRVTLTVDDAPFEQRTVKLGGAATAPVAFERKLPASGVLRAAVRDSEGYQADNVRYLVLDPAPRLRIVVVASPGSAVRDALYFQRAVAAVEGSAGIEVATVTADRLGADPAELAQAAALVVVGTGGLDRRGLDALAAAIRQGRSMLLTAGPSVELDRVVQGLLPGLRVRRAQDADSPVTMAPVDVRHPVFAAFGVDGGLLGSATFRRFVRLDGGEARVLARFSTGAAALVELSQGSGRLLVFASDLSNRWNDLVLHPVFVPLADDLARYLVGEAARPVDLRVGQVPEIAARAGVVTLPASGARPGGRAAVNVDAREGDPARMTADAFAAAIPKATAEAEAGAVAADMRRREAEQSLWRYGLALMLVGLVIESVIGRRG